VPTRRVDELSGHGVGRGGIAPQPSGRARVVAVEIALLVVGRQQHAELVIEKRAAADQCKLRIVLVSEVAVDHLRRCGEIRIAGVEWPPRDDANRAADPSFCHVGRRRLEHFEAVHEFDGQIAEVHVTPAVDREGQRGHAVDLDAIETRLCATNTDTAAFAVLAADLHAGDALERFTQILVGEIADVLGGDRVDDLDRLALHFHRGAQSRADAGDDDLRNLFRRGRRLHALRACGALGPQHTGDDRRDRTNRPRTEPSTLGSLHGSFPLDLNASLRRATLLRAQAASSRVSLRPLREFELICSDLQLSART
jgi:hypothetical protein